MISLSIVYQDQNTSIAYNFVLAYIFFTFFLLVYIPIIVMLNLKSFKWLDVRKKLKEFFILFMFFLLVNWGLDYIFRPERKDLIHASSTALGLAFGISFIDVIFSNNKNGELK